MSVVLKINKPNHKVLYFSVSPSDPVSVVDMGFEQKLPSASFGPAMRQNFLIHLVMSGCGVVERNGTAQSVKAGEAFIIRPGEVCTYKADDIDPWTYCWISFSGSFSHSLMENTTLENFTTYRKSGVLALKSAIDNVVEDEIGALYTLFAVLDSIKTESKQSPTDFVSSAVSYIENNYFRDFDITLLAKTLGISRSHFTTTFTARIGCTPYSYLLKTRLEHAKEILANTDLSVTEVAYSVGFSSIERFSEMFKTYVSLSPLAYRKSLKQV